MTDPDDRPDVNINVSGDVGKNLEVAGRDIIKVTVERMLSAAETAKQAEEFERQRLAEALVAYINRAQEHVQTASEKPPTGSPYKPLREFDIDDNALFFGRSADIDAVISKLDDGPLTILHAESGVGKTSLIKAGLIPRLLERGSIPVFVRPYQTPAHLAVKQTLLPRLEQSATLKQASLHDFMRQVVDLTGEQRIVIFLDQFEESFSQQTAAARKEFIGQIVPCLEDQLLPVRWVFSLRRAFYDELSTFRPGIRQPFANQHPLLALSPEQAREAVIEPAKHHKIEFETALADRLLADLGTPLILPTQLQLVCATLYDARGTTGTLSLDSYEKSGTASTILRDYLDKTLNTVSSDKREAAWLVLAALSDAPQHSISEVQLLSDLKAEEVSPDEARQALQFLTDSHLIHPHDETYTLASSSFLPRIEAWKIDRTVREYTRREVRRQFTRIRNSALRGLIGGALGFGIAFYLMYSGQYDTPDPLVYLSILRAVPGAFAGLILLLFIDIARASYYGKRRWLRSVVGAAAGIVSFTLALLMHGYARSFNSTEMLLAAAQGAIWGLIVGLGAVWMADSNRPTWQTLPVVILTSSIALWAAELFGNAFQDTGSDILVALAGAIFPLFILGTDILSRVQSEREVDHV